ncbi:hypothetical protein [Massilia niastensis]|uniref:hypothetical protein n=1 Tax=Massilia niastensis TaxID=544911 RepID=UPI00036C8401|nr:hypothetical protein [Massilia niastensis]
MPAISHLAQEKLLRLSRRQLWLSLGIIVVLGLGALLALASSRPETVGLSKSLFTLLPVFIVIAVVSLRSSGNPASADMQAIVNDELRQASLHRAWRNGFVGMLAAQALLPPLLAWAEPAYPLAVMAVTTILAGTAVFFASLLYHDR